MNIHLTDKCGPTGTNPLECTTVLVPCAVWSARRPVKPEVAGSNPVGTATTVASATVAPLLEAETRVG